MKAQRSPILFPILLVIVGILILLNNYLLINTDVLQFWPLLLVLIGLMVLWRGDLAPSWQAHSFGITRGNVESAAIEISSAEIDVRLAPLERGGRLIAGQYTARSRPRLAVRNTHAQLSLRRGDTWLFSLADWEVQLAQDLPWALLMSSHLGELEADLRNLQLSQVHIATGIGNIKVTSPNQEAGPIYLRSTFGDIHLLIPKNVPALIRVMASPMSRVITRGEDFQIDETQQHYSTPTYKPDYPALDIVAGTSFGNITLILGR